MCICIQYAASRKRGSVRAAIALLARAHGFRGYFTTPFYFREGIRAGRRASSLFLYSSRFSSSLSLALSRVYIYIQVDRSVNQSPRYTERDRDYLRLFARRVARCRYYVAREWFCTYTRERKIMIACERKRKLMSAFGLCVLRYAATF